MAHAYNIRGGRPPRHDEAAQEFHDVPPAGWPYTRTWLIDVEDAAGNMIAMTNVTSDLLAKGVWHIGLFIVATSRHGSGIASTIHEQLEEWMRGQGALWIRLGVVEGNARAERFWEKAGYLDVRKRAGVEMGTCINRLRVMAKPLAGGTLVQYLALVARDRPT